MTNKVLVIGGTSGLGKDIAERFHAHAIGRTSGHTLPESKQAVLDMSLEFDVVINCLPDHNQNAVLIEQYDTHVAMDKNTLFITLGNMGWRNFDDSHHKRQLVKWNDQIAQNKTSVRHVLFNLAYMYNSRNEGFVDPVSKEEFLETIDFLLKTKNYNSRIHLIEIIGKIKC